ncbi:MAG TPA: hypothetical protein PKM65_00030 [Spirochaetota bacterium]|nr:hypothetical protein [Spirochaetota bacterium]HNT12883.1 hypothetical protein [Spirochaetota bacterium]
MKRIVLYLIPAILASSLFSGCMGFQSGQARIIDPYPPKNFMTKKKPKLVSVKVNYPVDNSNVQGAVNASMAKTTTGYIMDVSEDIFDDSKYFKYAAPGKPSDCTLDIHIKYKANLNNCLSIASGLTLLIIPTVQSEEFTATCKLYRRGRYVGQRVIHQKLTSVYQMLLIVGMPFASVGTVEKRMWRRIVRDASVWMRDKI